MRSRSAVRWLAVGGLGAGAFGLQVVAAGPAAALDFGGEGFDNFSDISFDEISFDSSGPGTETFSLPTPTFGAPPPLPTVEDFDADINFSDTELPTFEAPPLRAVEPAPLPVVEPEPAPVVEPVPVPEPPSPVEPASEPSFEAPPSLPTAAELQGGEVSSELPALAPPPVTEQPVVGQGLGGAADLSGLQSATIENSFEVPPPTENVPVTAVQPASEIPVTVTNADRDGLGGDVRIGDGNGSNVTVTGERGTLTSVGGTLDLGGVDVGAGYRPGDTVETVQGTVSVPTSFGNVFATVTDRIPSVGAAEQASVIPPSTVLRTSDGGQVTFAELPQTVRQSIQADYTQRAVESFVGSVPDDLTAGATVGLGGGAVVTPSVVVPISGPGSVGANLNASFPAWGGRVEVHGGATPQGETRLMVNGTFPLDGPAPSGRGPSPDFGLDDAIRDFRTRQELQSTESPAVSLDSPLIPIPSPDGFTSSSGNDRGLLVADAGSDTPLFDGQRFPDLLAQQAEALGPQSVTAEDDGPVTYRMGPGPGLVPFDPTVVNPALLEGNWGVTSPITEVGPASSLANGDGSDDDAQPQVAQPPAIVRGATYATTGVGASLLINKAVNPNATFPELAPNLARGFLQDLVIGGGLSPVTQFDPLTNALLNGGRSAAINEGLSFFARDVLNPSLNAARDVLRTDPQALAIVQSPPGPVRDELVRSLVRTRSDATSGRTNIRSDFAVGLGRIEIPLLDPNRLTTSPNVDLLRGTPLRLDVGNVPDLGALTVTPPGGDTRLWTATPSLTEVPDGQQFVVTPSARTEPLSPRWTDGRLPVTGELDIFGLTNAPSEVRRRAAVTTDVTNGAISFAVPLLQLGGRTFAEAVGMEDNSIFMTTSNALATGLGVGGPISFAQGKLVPLAFAAPAGQSVVADAVLNTVGRFLPAEVQQVVAGACRSDDPFMDLAGQLACDLGQKGQPPMTPPAGGAAALVTDALTQAGPSSPTSTMPVRATFPLAGAGITSSPGEVRVVPNTDGTRTVQVRSTRVPNPDGTVTLYTPVPPGAASPGWNPGAQVTNYSTTVPGDPGNPGGWEVQKRTIRVQPHTQALVGGGTPDLTGSVSYYPNPSNPSLQSVTVFPAQKTDMNDGSTRYTGLRPQGTVVTPDQAAGGVVEFADVPVGTVMVPFDVTSAPRWSPPVDQPAQQPALFPATVNVPTVRNVPTTATVAPAPRAPVAVTTQRSPVPTTQSRPTAQTQPRTQTQPETQTEPSLLEQAGTVARDFVLGPITIERNGGVLGVNPDSYTARWLDGTWGMYTPQGEKVDGNGPETVPVWQLESSPPVGVGAIVPLILQGVFGLDGQGGFGIPAMP